MINEPHRGYIDLHSMHGFDYNTDLHLGPIRSSPLIFLSPSTNTNVYTYSLSIPINAPWIRSLSHRPNLHTLIPHAHKTNTVRNDHTIPLVICMAQIRTD